MKLKVIYLYKTKHSKKKPHLQNENAVLNARGRHDPCIVHRARVVQDSVTAIVLADMLIGRYGTDWLGNK